MEELTPIIVDWLQRGEQFALAEAPDVAAQLIVAGRMYLAIGVAWVTLAIVLLAVWGKRRERWLVDAHSEMLFVAFPILGLIFGFIGGLVIAIHVESLFAPKLYILRVLGIL